MYCSNWWTAKIVPIHKNGRTVAAGNYRPESLKYIVVVGN